MRAWVRLAVHLLLLTAVFWVLEAQAGPTAPTDSEVTAGVSEGSGQGLQIALLGDPQIGYGRGGNLGSFLRFSDVVKSVNSANVDLVVIPGDLVQGGGLLERWLVKSAIGDLQPPVIVTAGNHDVTDEKSLADYRQHFGEDYFARVFDDVAFVVINSETARDESISKSEYEKQWSWLEASLLKHSKMKLRQVFLVMHRPPFLYDPEEPESARNWPPEARGRLLDACRRYGVEWILAGHLHETMQIAEAGVTVEVVGGSAQVFDESPIGYKLVRVGESGPAVSFVHVADPALPPPSVPGVRGWTPRLFDFSIRHWAFTLLFLAAAWWTHRAAGQRGPAKPEDASWRLVTWGLLFFAVNMQLDFDELVLACGRAFAKLVGAEPQRHLLTGAGLVLLGAFVAVVVVRRYREGGGGRTIAVAFSALGVPSLWFCLSAISNHHLRMVLDETFWDLLTLLALAAIVVSARRHGLARNKG